MKNDEKINYLQKEIQIIKKYYTVRNFDVVIQKSKIILKRFPNETIFFNILGLAYKE